MTKSDLKVGMKFSTRSGHVFTVKKQNDIFLGVRYGFDEESPCTFQYFFCDITEDLKSEDSFMLDMMEVYDENGKLIWDRDNENTK